MRTDAYSRVACSYDSPRNQRFYSAIAAEMTSRFPGAALIKGQALDLACGTGISTEVFRLYYADLTWFAVDVSPEMLALATRKPALSGIHFSHAMAEDLPYPDHSFSLVTCNFAFHWFAPQAMQEIRRILKPGGILRLSAPLLGTRSEVEGNQFLRRLFLANRNYSKRSGTQGFQREALLEQFSDWGAVRVAVLKRVEEVSNELDLVQMLESRGSIHAIFGTTSSNLSLPPRKTTSPKKIQFEWNYAVLTAIQS